MRRWLLIAILILPVFRVFAQDVSYPCEHADIFNIYQIMVTELSEAVPAVDAQDSDAFFAELDDMVLRYQELKHICQPESAVTADMQADVFFALGDINTRTCASTTCDRADGLDRGDAIAVIGFEEGEEVNGSTIWAIFYDDTDAKTWVHRSLISLEPPPLLIATVPPTPIPTQPPPPQSGQIQQPTQQSSNNPAETQAPTSAPPPQNVTQSQSFSSTQYGYEAEFEVSLEAGNYNFRLSTDGYVTIDSEDIEGSCPAVLLDTPFDNEQAMDVQSTESASTNCRMRISVTNGFFRDADWTFTIERLG